MNGICGDYFLLLFKVNGEGQTKLLSPGNGRRLKTLKGKEKLI